MSFTSVFGGTVIQTSQQSYLALALAADTTLVWPRENQPSANVVADLIDVTPASSAFAITMPDARQASAGICTVINNISGLYTFTVKDSAGNVILTVAVGTVWLVYIRTNATAAGTWGTLQYGAQTGSINIAAVAGSGLKAVSSSLNQSMPVSSKSANYVAVDGDRARVLLWTGGAGTLTLPAAATVGSDWFVQIRNSGTGDWVVSPPAGTIDGAASKTFAVGGSGFVFTDGTNYYSIGYGLSASTTSFDYTTFSIAGTGDYTIAGAQLNRISYYLTGILTGNRNFVVPSAVQQYWINNGTTGAFSVTVKTAAGTGIVVTQGTKAVLYCDGTNVVDAQSTGVTLPLAIASGGTGSTTAATARTALGSTTVGDALFITASAAAARTTLGSGTVGDAVFVAVTASTALTAMAGGTLTGALTVTALLTAGLLTVTSATVPVNGMYLSAANTPSIAAASGLVASFPTAASPVFATALAIASGGTASTTAANARTALSVPSLTGTGASGSWGISVTGSSASCTGNAVTSSSCTGNSATATSATNATTSTTQAVGTNTTAIATTAFARASSVGGVGTSATDVTGGRVAGTPYTNSTGRPIFVSVVVAESGAGAGVGELYISGILAAEQAGYNAGERGQLCAVVPDGASYQVNVSGTAAISSWVEVY